VLAVDFAIEIDDRFAAKASYLVTDQQRSCKMTTILMALTKRQRISPFINRDLRTALQMPSPIDTPSIPPSLTKYHDVAWRNRCGRAWKRQASVADNPDGNDAVCAWLRRDGERSA